MLSLTFLPNLGFRQGKRSLRLRRRHLVTKQNLEFSACIFKNKNGSIRQQMFETHTKNVVIEHQFQSHQQFNQIAVDANSSCADEAKMNTIFESHPTTPKITSRHLNKIHNAAEPIFFSNKI